MKITDIELSIDKILDVKLGHLTNKKTYINPGRQNDSFMYVLSGSAQYFFGNSVHTVQAGTVMFLANKSKYKFVITSSEYTFLYIDFYFENEDDILLENSIYSSKNVSLLESSFRTLKRLWDIGNFSEKIYCKSLIYNIYCELAKSELAHYVTKDRRREIEKIAEYISDNISNSKLSVSQLSQMCEVSEVHFRRIFSKIYRTSPIKFITMLRLNKAKEMLLHGEFSIGEISRSCGFENQYYFSKIFKSENKLTPSEYRKLYKGNY